MESEELQSDVSQEPANEGHSKAVNQDASRLTMAESSAPCEGSTRQDKGGEMEEKSFVSNLHSFMKERGTPIERIPHLGFKQINLWRIFQAVGNLGGYDSVTARRLWKSVYDDLGGSPGSTSAATCTRRHYERLVLPFDRHLRGEADKPLPAGKPRKQYRRNVEKASKERGKRKTVRMEKELLEARRRAGAAEQSEAGAQAYATLWPVARPLPSGPPKSTEPIDILAAVYDGPRALHVPLPLSQPSIDCAVASSGTGLSPLEKKKRVAQASLCKPSRPQDDDKDRPTVIHCPQPQATSFPAPKSSESVEDSPGPVSTSSSRSSSPHSSLSSEDPLTAIGGKTEPNAEALPSYVALVSDKCRYVADDRSFTCGAISKGQDISFPVTQMLKTDSIQTENKDSVWKVVQRGSGRDSAHMCLKSPSPSFLAINTNWPPVPTSSFTKVIPKPVQPLKPTPFQCGYKIYPAGQQHDHSVKKIHQLPPWFCQTSERRDKSKLFPTIQPRSIYGGSQPPPSYLFPGYGRAGRDSLSQPPPLQAFLPERMRTPHSQPLYHQAPVGLGGAAHLGSNIYSYPSYCLSPWTDQSEYAGVSPHSRLSS